MPAARRISSLCLLSAVFFLGLTLSSAGAAGRGGPSSGDSSTEASLWKTFPDGGGYFQQRPDAPIIVIPSPPRLPALAAPEGAAGQHGRTPQKKVVPSFIPNEAMETGAFSGGL